MVNQLTIGTWTHAWAMFDRALGLILGPTNANATWIYPSTKYQVLSIKANHCTVYRTPYLYLGLHTKHVHVQYPSRKPESSTKITGS